MQLTERDYAILRTIYEYDGMLSIDQLHRWFFGVKRRAYYRIRALCEAKLLQRLPAKERYLVPEPIVWLSKTGAQVLADDMGVEYSELHWRSQPRWSRVSHDIALNEVRHTFEQALENHPRYQLETWLGQDALGRLFPTPIPYLDQQGERKQKIVQPDGYFCLKVQSEPPYRLRFFVELDNNTESSRRFGRDKVSPNIHLLFSPEYQRGLGGKSGRFLVVTVGSEQRFHHLRAEVANAGGAAYFLFTRSEWLQPETLLTEKVFYVPHLPVPFSFTTYDTDAFQHHLTQSLIHAPTLRTLFD